MEAEITALRARELSVLKAEKAALFDKLVKREADIVVLQAESSTANGYFFREMKKSSA